MLRIHAEEYVEIGKTLEQIRLRMPVHDLPDFSVFVHPSDFDVVIEQLEDIKKHCNTLGLETSSHFLDHHLRQLRWEPKLEWEKLVSIISDFNVIFTSQLSESTFFYVLPHRGPYYSEGQKIGRTIGEVLESSAPFPDARNDLREAGNCFAFERFTACVYHLMRAAEFGLVSVAKSVGVPEERWNSWESIIRGINTVLKAEESTKPIGWQERREKYSDLCSWFTAIKNGWRNPVSHVPRTYSEGTAKDMFSVLRTLFDHLNKQGIAQTPMPSAAIELPEEGINVDSN
jgi:hypothetical protein